MRHIQLIFFALLFISCSTNKTRKIKADLTFKSVSFLSFYGATDEKYENLIKKVDSTLNSTNEENEEIKLYRYFIKLKRHKILRKPYIFLNIEKDSVITVYLEEKEYEKIKNFKHVDLYQEGKKINLELEITEKEQGIYYSDNIIKINKVTGRSRSN